MQRVQQSKSASRCSGTGDWPRSHRERFIARYICSIWKARQPSLLHDASAWPAFYLCHPLAISMRVAPSEEASRKCHASIHPGSPLFSFSFALFFSSLLLFPLFFFFLFRCTRTAVVNETGKSLGSRRTPEKSRGHSVSGSITRLSSNERLG